MAGISKAISDELYHKCTSALKVQGKSGKVANKLQAIISAKEHNITEVARIFGITRATLFKWIKNFESQSIDGLIIKNGRGRKRILDKSKESIVKEIIENNPNITARALKQVISKQLSITISIASSYRLMHRLGFNYITPRKQHYKQKIQDIPAFKKTSKDKPKQ